MSYPEMACMLSVVSRRLPHAKDAKSAKEENTPDHSDFDFLLTSECWNEKQVTPTRYSINISKGKGNSK